MTRQPHFGDAQDLLVSAASIQNPDGREEQYLIGMAQVHATLALCTSLSHVRGQLEAIRDELAGIRNDAFLRGKG